MLNRWVLSRDRKTATKGAEVTRSGRLFQTREAATGKARSLTVRSRVWLTINDEDELERSCWRASTSATWQSSSVRYAGAVPCRHLYIGLIVWMQFALQSTRQGWRTSGPCWNVIGWPPYSVCSAWSHEYVYLWEYFRNKTLSHLRPLHN